MGISSSSGLAAEKEASRKGAVMTKSREESCLDMDRMDKSIFSVKVTLLIGWTFLEGRWSLLNAKSPACA